MTTPLSGTPITLRRGRYEAHVASVGASLRSLTVDGRDLVVPFEADEIRPVFRGAILAPWPNRIVDGTYSFDGAEYQLALTEPSRGHALHGLLAWADWAVVSATDAEAVLRAHVVPSDGYPWPIAVTVTYVLGDDGLTTTVEAVNEGRDAAPWGTAPHPYLSAGIGRVDDWTLTLPAGSYLEVTDDRLIGVGVKPVTERAGFDFREGHAIGDLFVDHCFTDLARDETGAATVTVASPDGAGGRMTFGTELPWVQIHTADRPEADLNRLGLAVEPMTCPPEAFTTGEDLVVLAPGASHRASWTIADL
ncbi:aldose 1-epimerase family protein [Frondihabitans australicus]|uniref:Aldose 1-epimerase n=1 Tax=Frondihabitans australicus TaxID=386892 RepID=A0A495ICU6_9MICO|nr:aldose 1-epimerase family protein [Frondihabitans australicus]RKR72925.1 aldose 1-epimerase [Frondihabitans australicus]